MFSSNAKKVTEHSFQVNWSNLRVFWSVGMQHKIDNVGYWFDLFTTLVQSYTINSGIFMYSIQG